MKLLRNPRTGIKTLWQDTHKRMGLIQFIIFVFIIYVVAILTTNIFTSLSNLDMSISFKFLKNPSHINIGESIIDVKNSSSFLRIIFAGFINTISITVVAIFFSTFIGIFIALCRLSSNWLIKKIAIVYIEIIRNIPLLLLLLIWYRAFFLKLPGVKTSFAMGKKVSGDGITSIGLSLSNRGLSMVWLKPTENFNPWLICLFIGLFLSIALIFYLKHRQKITGKEQRTIVYPLLLFIAFAMLTYFILPNKALYKDIPVLGKYNISGGLHITAEWFSLFSGLVLYTSGFIAEIFRSGIQGVPKGQIEAARALGLTHRQTIRLVIIPQAKVVIIPPLTSQFLGVAKNTSLGVAIGFPDMFAITGTIINQTGRTLEMILLIMSVYLILSLITSFFMNQYNKKVQLKER